MSKKVYFISLKTRKSLLKRIIETLQRSKLFKIFEQGDIIAIKLHMGEKNNTSFVRPIFVKKIYEFLISIGTKPFLTDTTTLYKGSRATAVDYLNTATWNGFNFAPIIIADGMFGTSSVPVEINKKHYSIVKIAEAIRNSDKIVVVTHFKGHEQTGFGGAIKNLGMGCAIKEGKLSMHSNAIPIIKEENCTGCKKCEIFCPVNAISMVNRIAVIDKKNCIGCGECIGICPFNAIKIKWDAPIRSLVEKMVEYAYGAVFSKQVIYINFLTNISPQCDCYPFSDAPIVPDIGILLSNDPVAIDQASFDLVKGSEWTQNYNYSQRKVDKFEMVNGGTFPEYQLDYAEKVGLGERKYELKRIGS